jgi:hypothetical protein
MAFLLGGRLCENRARHTVYPRILGDEKAPAYGLGISKRVAALDGKRVCHTAEGLGEKRS